MFITIKAKIKGPSHTCCGQRSHCEVKVSGVTFLFRSTIKKPLNQFPEIRFKLP